MFVVVAFLLCFMSTSSAFEAGVTNCNGTEFRNYSICNIDDLLENVTSNFVLELTPGNYFLVQSHLLMDLANIKIVSYVQSSRLICRDNGGIAFVNVTNLTIESLSIEGCALNASVLEHACKRLQLFLDMWFAIPSKTRVAVFIGFVGNVSLTNVTISNTKGIGILGINIMGASSITSTMVSQNGPMKCDDSKGLFSDDDIGGGIYLAYFDNYSMNHSESWGKNLLTISFSNFTYNIDCSFATERYFNQRSSSELKDNHYLIGGGGGLSIVYAHSNFSVSLRIINTGFYGNIARYGGGVHLATFASFSQYNIISFEGCTYSRNGVSDKEVDMTGYTYGGAGLAIFSDLWKPTTAFRTLSLSNITILIKDTLFVNNKASIEGGGIYAYSKGITQQRLYNLSDQYSIRWIVSNVSFIGNSAGITAAASFFQRTHYGLDGSVLLVLELVHISQSYSFPGATRDHLNEEVSSAVSVQHIAVQFQGVSIFEGNDVTALHVVSSVLFCQNNSVLAFKKNKGYRGGALYIEGFLPALILENNVLIHFFKNRAVLEGGAIFVKTPAQAKDTLKPSYLRECFISTKQVERFFDSNNFLIFHENKAPSGSSLYGADLNFCPWYPKGVVQKNVYQVLYDNFNNTFIFRPPPVGKEQVSGIATSIFVSAPTGALPGESKIVNITVCDNFGNDVFAIVTTDMNSSNSSRSLLGESGYVFTSQYNSTVRVFGPQNSTLPVSYFTYDSIALTKKKISLLSCPAGFYFAEDKQACICSSLLDKLAPFVLCDNETQNITVQKGYWLGMDLFNINSTITEELIFHDCYFNFCCGATFRPPNYDLQCASDLMRTGVMCGACKNGFSSTFSLQCRKCSNSSLYILVFLLIGGFVLSFSVAFLGCTVDRGWLYAAIHYSHLMALYILDLGPLFQPVQSLNFPIVALTLINFQNMCFYDGMTAMQRFYVLLLFPFVASTMMLIFYLLSLKISSMRLYFSPAKAFVTLGVLCYLSLQLFCTNVFAGVRISYLGNLQSLRWVRDPNQVYFSGTHVPIALLSYVLVFTVIWGFPLFLLFPSALYKLKFLKRGKPIYDALYAPFKDKYRFWLGVKLLVLYIVHTLARVLVVRYSVFLNTLILLLTVHIQTSIMPYKKYWQNILDSYFIVIVVFVIFAITSFLNSFSSSLAVRMLYSVITVVFPFIIWVATILFHIHLQFPKIQETAMRLYRNVVKKKEENPTVTTDDDIPLPRSFVGHNRVTTSNFSVRRVVRMSGSSLSDTNVCYRETLFEDSI